MRLKEAFRTLWREGTDFIEPSRIQNVLTSKELKVKLKKNNISGLQLADLIAHPSRNEILKENGHFTGDFPPFAQQVVKILVDKYYQKSERIYGKKFI